MAAAYILKNANLKGHLQAIAEMRRSAIQYQRTELPVGHSENNRRFAPQARRFPILLVRFSCKKRRTGAENARLRHEKPRRLRKQD